VYDAPHLIGVVVDTFRTSRPTGDWDPDGGGADLYFLLLRGGTIVLDGRDDPRVTRSAGPVIVPNAGVADLPVRWVISDFVVEPLNVSYRVDLRDEDVSEGGNDEAVGQTVGRVLENELRALPNELEFASVDGLTRVRLLLDWRTE
jgi:hypothetical protein